MSNLAINNRTISESIEDDFRWKLIVVFIQSDVRTTKSALKDIADSLRRRCKTSL